MEVSQVINVFNWAENYIYSIISSLVLQNIMEFIGLDFRFTVLNMTGPITLIFLLKFHTRKSRFTQLTTANFSLLLSTCLFPKGSVHTKPFAWKDMRNQEKEKCQQSIVSFYIYLCFLNANKKPYYTLLLSTMLCLPFQGNKNGEG